MSPGPFPEHPDADKLFARNGVINAGLPLARLSRFNDYLAEPPEGSSNDAVQVKLRFGHDEEGRRRMQGSLGASVWQLCQRCLQPMRIDLDSELDLMVLEDEEQLGQIPEAEASRVDVIVEDEGGLDVVAVIEDELILSLPLVPVHEDENCNRTLSALKRQADEDRERGDNPFAALAALKEGFKDKNSGDSESRDNKSGDNKSGDNKSGDNKSGDNKSGDNKK